ncbi:MAG: electron transfer flavoprotein subunit beta/FixA family protein [Nitrospinae bacterium]|nr:electron transfer flavoprotein subunit beta/FixA family protein [Nitrospinota bacterium]
MDIIVCLKRVPDTGARIEIEKDGIDIKSDLPWIINPYDEFAVEEAIRIKERFGGRITLINAGGEGGEEVLKKGIAMGADSSIYIKDPLVKNLDNLGIAKVLSKVISTVHFDIILCGKTGIDDNAGIIGGALAGILNIPCISAVNRLKIFPEKKIIEASREVEGGIELVESPIPAVITAAKGLNEPRYPSLSGIMRAKKHEINFLNLNSIGIDIESLFHGTFKRTALSYLPLNRKGIILNVDRIEQVKEAVKFLRDEVKIF